MNPINEKLRIKNVVLPNRLVMPPMATSRSIGGAITPELLAYYNEKSQGGHIGLIITEHCYVSLEGKASIRQTSISSDDDIAGWKRLVDLIHGNNTIVFAQISHAGGATTSEITGLNPLSASAINIPRNNNEALPQEMNDHDIAKVISDFAAAALRAKQAGFDGVEIHSAHGYLLNQFYSPFTNKRTDKYTGASVEGRIRLHLEIIAAIKEAVGPDYPLALRLGACDYLDGGTTIDHSIQAAQEFEKAGIDILDITGGLLGYSNPDSTKPGWFASLSQAIKENVTIPVLLTGGIVDGVSANDLLATNKADLIGVGRSIMKDSNWAKNNL
ncbi:MAG: NADH:flavin oxidoreductase [Erysipelotrichaceae bacterium]|nr:NADH:flavin oxidoreductase [Erysipelotrichaceae bacterium]MDD3809289.1 NADH:flavin oxidoreductase [Erysipelotrichaceae bacterium]